MTTPDQPLQCQCPMTCHLLMDPLLLSHHVQAMGRLRGTMRRDEHVTELLVASQVAIVGWILGTDYYILLVIRRNVPGSVSVIVYP